jgi:hypothetical protein
MSTFFLEVEGQLGEEWKREFILEEFDSLDNLDIDMAEYTVLKVIGDIFDLSQDIN